MSNILFANQDRLKTIGRFLLYDNLVSLNEHNLELEQVVEYKGKKYKIKVKVSKLIDKSKGADEKQ